ncbi:MAG: sugar transferase [Lachnospiraceae bacterium]|nr:sugar transferase [Lachnospiraceae bacterium]
MYNNKKKTIYLLMNLMNALCVMFSCLLSIYLIDELGLLRPWAKRNLTGYYVLVLVSYFITFVYLHPYAEIFKKRFWNNIFLIFRQNLVFAVVMSVLMMVTRNSMMESRYVYFTFVIINTGVMVVATFIFKRYVVGYYSRRKHAVQVGIATTYDRAEEAIKEIRSDWDRKIFGICILDRDMKGQKISGAQVKANRSDFENWVRVEALDEVVLYVEYYNVVNRVDVKALVEMLEEMGVTVHLNLLSLDDFADYQKKITYFSGHPMLTVSQNIQDYRKVFIKRAIDIVGGLIGCLISLPIIGITAIPLLIESPGGLIFKQQRVGLNGRYFYIYKLRSMYADAEERLKELQSQNTMKGNMFKMDNDPRITKVGHFIRKYSIDELPQFFNVLKGDMSLVGTRPPTVNEFKLYKDHHKRRLSMKPGITGMWQVSGRSRIKDFEEIVRLDLQYIDNWSLWMDFKILCKTVLVVMNKQGAQ